MELAAVLGMIIRGAFIAAEMIEKHQTEATKEQLDFIQTGKKMEREGWKEMFPDLFK